MTTTRTASRRLGAAGLAAGLLAALALLVAFAADGARATAQRGARVAGAPALAAHVAIGIGDQKPDMFSDPRFQALAVGIARRNVSWDTLTSSGETAALDRWLDSARALGIQPLIGFDHSWKPGRHKLLPTPAQFGRQFRRFRRRYPWVRDFATWNEANYCGQKLCHRPDLAAAYYHVLRRQCPHCIVLAAELLDAPGMVAWVRRFDHFAHVDPGYWGLHDYIGANRFQTASTRRLLRATHGQIWLTEIAGLVARHNHSHVAFRQGPNHAADVTAFIFRKLVRLSPRITRVYLYEWDPVSRLDSWDSALIGLDHRPRPAYDVLLKVLERQRGWRPTQPSGTTGATGAAGPPATGA